MRQALILAIFLSAGATFALASCSTSTTPAAGCGQLQIHSAWVTPAHTGSREMLGYFTLHNAGSQPVQVKGITSNAFDRAIFQERANNDSNEDGDAAQPLGQFEIAAGKDMTFQPGQREVVLYSPTRAYENGDTVRLTLTCGTDHARQTASATVRSKHGDQPVATDTDRAATNRKNIIKDGQRGGGPGAADDSRTAD